MSACEFAENCPEITVLKTIRTPSQILPRANLFLSRYPESVVTAEFMDFVFFDGMNGR